MIEAIALSIAFVMTSLFASSFVAAMPEPFTYLPLMMITGLLVLHRVGIFPGAVWLFGGGIYLHVSGTAPGNILPLLVTAAAGAILVEKTFATRSVFALLGLGFTTGVLAGITRLLMTIWEAFSTGAALQLGAAVEREGIRLMLLIAGLYVGFVVMTSTKSYAQKLFVVRSS